MQLTVLFSFIVLLVIAIVDTQFSAIFNYFKSPSTGITTDPALMLYEL
jgi:hypothetical protein